jgi:hypothetical protein
MIQDKRDTFHLPVLRFLLECDTKLSESLTSLSDIVNCDRKCGRIPARLGVAIYIALQIGNRQGSALVGEVQHVRLGLKCRGSGRPLVL